MKETSPRPVESIEQGERSVVEFRHCGEVVFIYEYYGEKVAFPVLGALNG